MTNLLLLHCHDLGRFLGCYGIPTVQTPHLDRLAAEGVQFDRAFCTAPQCSPSRASLFTGHYPHQTGMLGLPYTGWDLHPWVVHLAGMLSQQGYRTELLGIHHESASGSDDEVATRLGFDLVDRLPANGQARSADRVADRCIAALSQRAEDPDRPFYLQVGFIEPHRLMPLRDAGTVMGFVGDYIVADSQRGVTVPDYLQAHDPGTRTEIAELQGAVRYLDAACGRILAALDELDLADDTIVVFTTDHGLALPRAKGTLYDPGLETALLVRAPHLGWVGGRRLDAMVSNVDLVPTMLDGLGLAVPTDLAGRTFRPVLDGDCTTHHDRVFGELTYHAFYDPLRCVRTSTHKLIITFEQTPSHLSAVTQSWRPRSTPLRELISLRPPAVQLFDLAADPVEMTNRHGDPQLAAVESDLSRTLWKWMARTEDPLVKGPVMSPRYRASLDFLSFSERRDP